MSKISNEQFEIYKDLFVSDRRFYYLQYKTRGGEVRYTKSRGALNDSVLRAHLNCKLTVGVIPINVLRKSTKFSVFDIDSRLLGKLGFVEVIDTLKEILLDFGLRETQIHVERSGLKGYHTWVFFTDFIKAKVVIEWAKFVVRELHSRTERNWFIDNSLYKCEIRPEGETENTRCIKLPLSIHRENGQRSVFVNDNLNPYRDQGKRIEIAGENRVGSSVIFEVVRDRYPTSVQLELGLGDNNELYDLLLRTGAACLLYYAKNGLDGVGQRHEVMLSLAIALDSLEIPPREIRRLLQGLRINGHSKSSTSAINSDIHKIVYYAAEKGRYRFNCDNEDVKDILHSHCEGKGNCKLMNSKVEPVHEDLKSYDVVEEFYLLGWQKHLTLAEASIYTAIDRLRKYKFIPLGGELFTSYEELAYEAGLAPSNNRKRIKSYLDNLGGAGLISYRSGKGQGTAIRQIIPISKPER